MDLSQTPGTLDADDVAVPCRRSGCRLRSVSGDVQRYVLRGWRGRT